MKWNYKLLPTMITSFAVTLILSLSAFAQSHEGKRQEPRQGGESRQGNRTAPQGEVRKQTPPEGRSHTEVTQSKGNVSNDSGSRGHDSRPASSTPSARQNFASPAPTRSYQSGDRSAPSPRYQASPNQHGNNRSNHYGGRWVSADNHRDWDRGREHCWNRHNYRWYDGGWLIIDLGFTPDYPNEYYVAQNVQRRLANQGYYNGAIDGDVGPGTRNAIARYQRDHYLVVTGNINDPLLQSLQLE